MGMDDFNPHFRKGSDGGANRPFDLIKNISIHTSAREVTVPLRQQVVCYQISIHTSAREVTVRYLARCWRLVISIHTSAREVTRCKPPF